MHHLSKGRERFFTLGELTLLTGRWELHPCFCEALSSPTWVQFVYNLVDMKPTRMCGARHTPGIRLSIDHKDRHWSFILHTPLRSPQPTNGSVHVYGMKHSAENFPDAPR